MSTDPYGVDLAVDATGDLRVTASGALATVTGPYTCAQAVFLRLKTTLGDLPLHPDYGSQLETEQVGAKLNALAIASQLGAELQTLVANDPRFRAAQITQTRIPATSGQDSSMQLGVQATLVGGEQLALANTSDPNPSDVAPPSFTSDPTLTLDALGEDQLFQGNDPTELDTLQDLDAQSWLVENSQFTISPGG